MRSLVKNSFPLSCIYYLATDILTNFRYKIGKIDTNSGTHHSTLDTQQSVNYVLEVFDDYKTYSGIGKFSGKIAEIGPGDNCGVGLLLLNDGASHVDLVDRFYSKRNAVSQASIYKSLLSNLPFLQRHLAHADLTDESTFKNIKRCYGPKAAAEEFFESNKGYSFIVSRAVFEHLYNPVLAMQKMADAIIPGGYLIHKVDLRDHGMFSNNFHELKFLEPSDVIYRNMTVASGRPNRVLVNEYRACLEKTGLEFEILVTRLAGVGDIIPHQRYENISSDKRKKAETYVRTFRTKFARKFNAVSDEDLAVAGIFIVARKKSE